MEPRVTLPEILFEAEVEGCRYRVVKTMGDSFCLEDCRGDSMKGERWETVYMCGEKEAHCLAVLFRLLELMKRSKQLAYFDDHNKLGKE